MAKHCRKLAVLLLAVACSGDATAPDPVESESPAPRPLNRAPALSGQIPAQRLPGPREAVAVAVGTYFTDPDGDVLTFVASSADTAVVSAAVEGDTLRLTGGGTGGAGTVTVTATDPSGLSARAAVAVTVNRAPVAAGDDIPAQTVIDEVGQVLVDVLAGTFTDPDGDSLWFDAESSDTSVVEAGCCSGRSGGPWMVWLRPVAHGGATVTVTARDPDGLEARAAFAVEVTEHPDRAALAALFEATDGPNWTNNENWLTDAPLAEWHGVSVWDDGRVSSLYLDGNALSGSIPPEIGNLASLVSLAFTENRGLTGPIPPEIGNLASLEALLLDENVLTGPIPPELGNLASLETLWLQDNDLSGPIPPELGGLPSLEALLLNDNNLSGPIPPELGGLPSLKDLWLHNNDLSGPIPPELVNLTLIPSLPTTGFHLPTGSILLSGNPKLCVPNDPQLRAWLIERRNYPYPCRSTPDVRLLPLALMRADGNGLSLALPDDLHAPAVSVSDPGVVAASFAEGWLELIPRSIGRADVELVPSGGGSPAIAGVVVRKAVGTFGIDIVMEQPAPLAFEETMVAAADWWSSVLDGTEWEDRWPGCFNDEATALADELLIHAGIDAETGYAGYAVACFFPPGEEDSTTYEPAGGEVRAHPRFAGVEGLLRHEIGHILGLVKWPVRTGLTTQDRAHFTGPRAVEAYRTGGGDSGLPGVPLQEDGCRCHWQVPELMGRGGGPGGDGLSLAALTDAGYTVDMTKATPWRMGDNAAVARAAEPFRERVEVRIVPRPVPE